MKHHTLAIIGTGAAALIAVESGLVALGADRASASSLDPQLLQKDPNLPEHLRDLRNRSIGIGLVAAVAGYWLYTKT